MYKSLLKSGENLVFVISIEYNVFYNTLKQRCEPSIKCHGYHTFILRIIDNRRKYWASSIW